MAAKKSAQPFVTADAIGVAFATNNRINIYLLENLPADAWRAKAEGGKGRDVASIAAHMHNVRLMWLKAVGSAEIPEKLDPLSVTQQEAIAALEQSSEVLARILAASLNGDGRIRGFKPDAAGFFGYLIAHDAHHRGQITMLARQLGHPVSQKTMFGMWEWGSRGA